MNGIPQTEIVTRMQAARRQLAEAVVMHFDGRDYVAIHSIAAAANQLLADMGAKEGYAGVLRNKDVIVEGKWRQWRQQIAGAEQFFKHADKDDRTEIEFTPFLTLLCILDALEIYRVLNGRVFWEGYVFLIWLAAKYPDFVWDGQFKDVMVQGVADGMIDPDDFEALAQLVRMNDHPNLKDNPTLQAIVEP